MDIPVPADSAVNSDNEKIPVTTSVSQPKPPEQSALSKTPEKEPTISKEDEERKKTYFGLSSSIRTADGEQ